tara:strand:- start:21533 stop:21880 length:348 start_codon:yes stop_codon:yes gene_type:complete
MRDYNFGANYASSKDLSSSNYYTGSVQKACTPEISKYDRLISKVKDSNYKLVVIETRGNKVERTTWLIKRVIRAGMDNFPSAIEAVKSFKPNVRSEYFDVDSNMSLMSNHAIIKY